MKWCIFSYECHKTSSQDHPTGLEKFCLQEHNPFWCAISEADIELSQVKYVAKPMSGRMRDNIFSLIIISAYWRNLENNSYPKQTKALWHPLQRIHGRERYEFFTAVCITTLEILNERKTSICPEDLWIGIKVSQNVTFGTDSVVRQKKKKKKSVYL